MRAGGAVAVLAVFVVASVSTWGRHVSLGWPVVCAATLVGLLLLRGVRDERGRLESIAASELLTAGVMVSALCTLAMPLPPFHPGGRQVALLAVAVAAWGAVIKAVRRGVVPFGASASQRLRLAVRLAAAVVGLGCLIAVVQARGRPTSEDYWESLVPVPVNGFGWWLEEQDEYYYENPVESIKGLNFNPCRDRFGPRPDLCEYIAENRPLMTPERELDRHLEVRRHWRWLRENYQRKEPQGPGETEVWCIGLPPYTSFNPGIMMADGGGTGHGGCPETMLRRDPRNGHFVIERKDGRWEEFEAYVLKKGRQGPRLSAWSVGDSVRMPAPWIGMAAGGLLVVGGALYARRRRARSGREGASGAPGGTSGTDASDHGLLGPSEQAFWRWCLVMLAVSGGPMVAALVVGVGR